MNFIWDIILVAEENNMKKEDIFFKIAQDCSPWCEQSFPILNEKKIPDQQVEVNPLFRFGSVFGSFLHPELDELPEFQAFFMDIALHFICETDLQKGITPNDIYKKFIKDEFLNMDERSKAVFFSFSSKEQEIFLISYLNQLKIGSSLSSFREVIHHIYPNALLYQIKDEPEQLLLYLSTEENEEKKQQVELLLDCFMPLYYHISVFWTHHFGALEVDQTMKLEKIQLF